MPIHINTPKRKAGKKKYYNKHNKHDINSHKPYTEDECELILEHKIPDVQLSKELGRTLRAIHIKRVTLNNQRKGIAV